MPGCRVMNLLLAMLSKIRSDAARSSHRHDRAGRPESGVDRAPRDGCCAGSVIQVENLTKSFGEFTAVCDVSFEVKPGEIFAFLGPNGAGKTTTIKMLTTLLRPTGGRIDVDGIDPQTQPNEVRKRFGIV